MSLVKLNMQIYCCLFVCILLSSADAIAIDEDFVNAAGQPLTIAVIGTGRVGGALGPRFAQLGITVIYGSRDPNRESVRQLVARTGNNAIARSQKEAAKLADWVLLAVPWKAVDALLQEIGPMLGDKIVIDATNALRIGDDGLMAMAVESSAGQIIQSSVPDAKLVKAFNTMGFHIMAEPAAAGGPVSVPIVGDDVDAKIAVASLVTALGFDPVDVGPIRHAHATEQMAILYMVPYMSGNSAEQFEFYFRKGTGPALSEGVRPAE